MIGERLKNLRVNAKLTQKDVADIMNVTPQTISKWELNLSEPSLDLMKELAALYGVKVDELLNSSSTLSYEVQSNFKMKSISLYIMYVLLLGLAVAIAFVPYLSADMLVIDEGFLYVSLPTYRPTLLVELTLTSVFLLSILMGIPVILFTLHLVDRKFIGHIVVSFIALIIQLSYLVPILASPLFMAPKIGMILHIIYLFIMIGILLISVSIQKWNIYHHIQNHPKTWIGFAGMILMTLILPFSFNESHHYYMNTLEAILLGVLFFLAGLLMFKDMKRIQLPIFAFSFLMMLYLLISVGIYMLNSGLILGGMTILSYMLFLGLSMSELKHHHIPFKSLFKLRILPFELIIFSIYLYLLIQGGDLFFYYIESVVSYNSIHLNDLPSIVLFYISLIVLFLGLVFRWMKVKWVAIILYSIWLIFQIYYVYLVFTTYRGEGWYVTDGRFIYIPVLVGLLYLILYIGVKLFAYIKKKTSQSPALAK